MALLELDPMFLEYLTEDVPINRFYPLPLLSVHLPFYHDPIDFIEKKCKFLYYRVMAIQINLLTRLTGVLNFAS